MKGGKVEMGFEFKLNMTAMEEKKFGAWVTDSTNFPELFNKFALWNRADLRDQLITQLRAHNAAHLIPVPMVVPQERNIGIEEAVQARLVIKRKPLANPRYLIIHRRSVAAFLLASPGNAFSAIAMIGHVKKEQKVVTTKKLESKLQKQIRTELVGRPKIFLCPASQLTKTTGGSSQGYVPKEHINAQTGVYRVSVIGTISHRASDIKLEGTTARIVPGSVASHTQMSELVRAKSKYESLNQRDGHFVGFTVSKGESGGVW